MVALLILALLAAVAIPAGAGQGAVTVAGLEFRGATSFATGFSFGGTEVGGLSGLTYDARQGVYYALSDDRSQRNPARFYTLAIDLADGTLDAGDVRFLDVTLLRDRRGATFAPLSTDPEGIFLVRPKRLYVSSEGDASADPPIHPFVRGFRRRGRQRSALVLPDKFLPDVAGTRGVRVNLALESLTSPPDRWTVITASENALRQDGPAADVGQPSLARILELDPRGRARPREYVYVVEPVAEAPEAPDAFRTNGLVELLALDGAGTFLALERSFTIGKGNTVILYEVSTAGATDVSGYESLFPDGSAADFQPVRKRRLLDVGDVGVVPDNLEGMAFGPPMADGRLPLVLMSDNNFSPVQETQFILFAVDLEKDLDEDLQGDLAADLEGDPEVDPERAGGSELSRPARLVGGFDKTSKILTFALIGGALSVLETADTDTIEDIGDVLQFALPAAAFGATVLERDGRGRRDFLKSVGTSSLTVILLKEALDKARPNAQGLNSFPSGHTASAFSGASFVKLRYGARWGAPALVLAGYTGASRIYADKHFLDDVISGMSISLLANRYFVFPIVEDLQVMPLASDRGAGLALRWKGSLERWRARSFDAAALPPQLGFRYEWEFGGTGVDVNEFAAPGSAGAISYLFDEANNPTVTARIELGYTPPGRPRQELVAQVAPFEVRDFGRFARDTAFAGKLVPGGETLRTQYLLHDYRLRYRYLVRSSERLRIRAGGGISFQDIVATLSWTDDEADIEEGNWAPFAHVDLEIRLAASRKLRLLAEIDAGRSGEDRSIDAALALRYEFHPRWDLGIGTRRIERTIVTDRLRNRLERDQVVVAIGYSF